MSFIRGHVVLLPIYAIQSLLARRLLYSQYASVPLVPQTLKPFELLQVPFPASLPPTSGSPVWARFSEKGSRTSQGRED
jgi:hypothetical protein